MGYDQQKIHPHVRTGMQDMSQLHVQGFTRIVSSPPDAINTLRYCNSKIQNIWLELTDKKGIDVADFQLTKNIINNEGGCIIDMNIF